MAAEKSTGAGAPDREQRLDNLLLEVFELPEEKQRPFLEKACADDKDLLEEAFACIALEKQLTSFLEVPAIAGMVGSEGVTKISLAPELPEDLAETLQDPPRTETAEPTTSFPSAPGHRPLGRGHLGAYKIVGHLGAGGMGQVYIGEDARLGRRIAVKTLPPEMAGRPGWLERFEREARALATLNHPNIVTIHSIEEDRGIRFLTMEMIEGKTLQETIPEGGLPLEDFLHIAMGLTDALAAAHEQGVIHRDLKPANVMITKTGRVKILDFGIAKVTGKLAGSKIPAVSQEGMLIGTVSYMAPEQLKGEAVDARSDLFALGVVFHLMATGEHPFPAKGALQRVPAILKNEPLPLDAARKDLPQALGEVIIRCLEKDPAERYQSAEELHDDLEELRRGELTAQLLLSRPEQASKERPRTVLITMLVTLLVAAGLALTWWQFNPPPPPAPAEASAETVAEITRTPLAVLFFQNLTGDPQLDWLSNGIPELLVTDLSQSPGLKVLGTGEVHRILTELGVREEIALTPEMVQQAATVGKVDTVIRGSYAFLGDVLRVAYSIENPTTGEVLTSESLEGQGQESLFALVDQLSSSVLGSLGAVRPDMGPATLQEATTASVAAWQAFSEGVFLNDARSKPEEAIEYLEKALQIDPDFALAFVTLAKAHQNLGHTAELQINARKAFELREHLPLNNRFTAEANYYGSRWATTGRAIETYNLALKVYSDRVGWRNNLARRYAYFERYTDAIQEFEQVIDSGRDYWGNYHGAANSYAALGDFNTGYRLLSSYAEQNPDNWWIHYSLAWHYTEWRRFDKAQIAFDRLAEMRPDSPQLHYGRWRLAVLRQDWEVADREARWLIESEDSFGRFRGNLSRARNALYRGRSTEALLGLDAAAATTTGADRALAHCFKAELLLTLGQNQQALEEARQAQVEGADHWPELRGYFLAALAEQALGRPTAADTAKEILRERWRRQPNFVEERQLHHLAGLLALARGETQTALNELQRAAALLPTNGIEFSWHVFPDHVPIWTALGQAELAAERPEAALVWLQRATESGAEHLEQPVSYVHAFYLSGLILWHLGQEEEARQSFENFLEFWGDGDFDPKTLATTGVKLTPAETSSLELAASILKRSAPNDAPSPPKLEDPG